MVIFGSSSEKNLNPRSKMTASEKCTAFPEYLLKMYKKDPVRA